MAYKHDDAQFGEYLHATQQMSGINGLVDYNLLRIQRSSIRAERLSVKSPELSPAFLKRHSLGPKTMQFTLNVEKTDQLPRSSHDSDAIKSAHGPEDPPAQ